MRDALQGRWTRQAAPGLAFALWLLAAPEASAQIENPEVGRVIGRAIAAGVALATDEFASGGRYVVDDQADTTFRVRQVGARHRFEGANRWEPFVGGRVGQVLVDQKIDLGAADYAAAEFDVTGLAVEGGSLLRLNRGWFGELWAEVSYSLAEDKLEYPDSPLAESLRPILDGVLVNWEAEALSLEAGLGLGWERLTEKGLKTTLLGMLTGLRTDPVKTDHPIQDITVETWFARLLAGLEVPLGLEIFARPLRLDPRVRVTLLDHDLSDPLDTRGFVDLRLALLALLPETRLPIHGVGLAVTYTHADTFTGWSVGLSFGH